MTELPTELGLVNFATLPVVPETCAAAGMTSNDEIEMADSTTAIDNVRMGDPLAD
jgi:hypothetical protein